MSLLSLKKEHKSNFIQYKIKFCGIKYSFKKRFKVSSKEKNIYTDFLENKILKKEDNFVPITTQKYSNKNSVKPIAFYLPQFHSIPLNDKNFGKGFTEWTNVTQAMPMYVGHKQPHIPIDVGFYDLNNDDVMYRQVELAKMYGIYGFCFHYYWFSGKRLLEKPIFNYLKNKELDLPFCLCWANENWSKLWDGGNKEIIMKQQLNDDDDEKFFYDILPFFKDERYIKIDNKPVLLIYRVNLFSKERILHFIRKQRELAKKEGLGDLYICSCFTFGINESYINEIDGWVEFPPHNIPKDIDKYSYYINKNFQGSIINMHNYIKANEYTQNQNVKRFKGVFPGWDNTARKACSNACIFKCSPQDYKLWLQNIIKWTKVNHKENEQFIFINAWNEWGEGAHLEPDTIDGYAYLEATKNALEESV